MKRGINPVRFSGSSLHTQVMKTESAQTGAGQIQVLTPPFGGARRDEEKSPAPRSAFFPSATASHAWDPKNQRPELWRVYNTRINKGESIRVFPLSNWTELDIWQYILAENIPIVPLYFAKKRPVVERDGTLIMRDDDRMKLKPGEKWKMRNWSASEPWAAIRSPAPSNRDADHPGRHRSPKCSPPAPASARAG